MARRVGELRVGEAEGAGEVCRDGDGDGDGSGGGGGGGGGEGEGGGGGEGGGEGGEGEGVLRRAVHYCSHQNSSLTEEFEELQADWRPLAWADAAFGAPPAATNLWMGEGPCRKQGLHGRAARPKRRTGRGGPKLGQPEARPYAEESLQRARWLGAEPPCFGHRRGRLAHHG